MIFQVLIVDDEPHVVESISTLLEKNGVYELELHAAYRAQQAMEIMKQGRIDLLLTDIQMPGMNGLALIREVKRHWPDCASVILSAYSEFQYAYEAIELGVAGYILKTEEESDILARLNGILAQIEANLNHCEWTAPPPPRNNDTMQQSLFMKLLYDAQCDEATTLHTLQTLGFHPGEALLMPVMVVCPSDQEIESSRLTSALQRYLGDKLLHFISAPINANLLFVLLELNADTTFLASTLETVQASFHTTFGQVLSFLLGHPYRLDKPLNQVRHMLKRTAAKLEDDFDMCVMELDKSSASGQVTVEFLKNYINAHINEELSLMQLAQITGYNASYLSRMFSTEAHEPLVRYIARKRLEAIRTLMLDPELSLEQIMSLTNFNSRSYFNSFIKKETGLSPKKYRAQVGVNSQDD